MNRPVDGALDFKWCEYWWNLYLWDIYQAKEDGDRERYDKAITQLKIFEDFISGYPLYMINRLTRPVEWE